MADHWFRPKAYGYGATPSNWKGWPVTAGAVALVICATLALIVRPELSGTPAPFMQVMLWATLVGAITGGLVVISRAKTDGEWKWRWGGAATMTLDSNRSRASKDLELKVLSHA